MRCDFVHFQGIPARGKSRPSLPPIPRVPVAVESGEAQEFFRELLVTVGLSSDSYRSSALLRRVPACLRFLRAKDLAAARVKLAGNPSLARATVHVVLLGVTEFCRDQPVFQYLRERVIPELALLGRPLHVWSAACSDGRELYSLAILLHEAGLLTTAHLLGTDCRSEAIEHARKAQYASDALDKLDHGWKNHFITDRDGIRPSETLKSRLRWKQADLLRGAEPGPWDVVSWRNMAIYLEPQTASRLWDEVLHVLAPGGFLVTGKADHPPRHPHLEKLAPCVYRKALPVS